VHRVGDVVAIHGRSHVMCLTISGEVVMDLAFLLMPGEYHIVGLIARLSHGPDQAAPPENCPSDFRRVRAPGGFSSAAEKWLTESLNKRVQNDWRYQLPLLAEKMAARRNNLKATGPASNPRLAACPKTLKPVNQ
jgi:hypothetical protein